MTFNFTYSPPHTKVIFQRGFFLEIPNELNKKDVKSVFIICSNRQLKDIEAIFNNESSIKTTYYTEAKMHTPIEVTEQALTVVEGADLILAIGGGSVIGLSKALSLRTGTSQMVVPTTYAGSEMTPILGETVDGVKQTKRDARIQAGTVIYDSSLLETLPQKIAGPSAMNALAHSFEALYAEDRNPITSLLARESIEVIMKGLVTFESEQLLYGAYLAGTCLGSVGMSFHHKACHVLGGSFNLSHGDIHCFMLPYTLAYNASAVEELLGDKIIDEVYDLMLKVGNYKSLQEFGLGEDDLKKACDLILKQSYYSPRPLEARAIMKMFKTSYEGRHPKEIN